MFCLFEGPCFLGGKHFKQPSLPGWKVKDNCSLALTENDFKLFSIGHPVHYDILRRIQKSGFVIPDPSGTVHRNASVIIQESQRWIHGNTVINIFIHGKLSSNNRLMVAPSLKQLRQICLHCVEIVLLVKPVILECFDAFFQRETTGYWQYVLWLSFFVSRRK